jgi:hypothetical protein
MTEIRRYCDGCREPILCASHAGRENTPRWPALLSRAGAGRRYLRAIKRLRGIVERIPGSEV